MGAVPNSQMIFSEKDLNSLDFDFHGRPSLEFEKERDIARLEQNFDQDIDKNEEVQDGEPGKDKEEAAEKCQIWPYQEGEFSNIHNHSLEDEDDGFKTPTSMDHKIPPVILQCPPAPRKPKSLPSTKRKWSCRGAALLDLSNEIEALFPPALIADLGAKIKKARQGNDTK